MIIKDINGYDYRISFKHLNEAASQKATSCFIEKVKTGGQFKADGTILSTGHAICDSRDMFNKATGRKISMKRAMQESGIDRSNRSIIWEKYLNR